VSTLPVSIPRIAAPSARLGALAIRYAQLALGASFLSAVADRFGLLGQYGGWGNMTNFTEYTAKVLAFMPASTVPFFAWTATAAETVFGLALVLLGLLPQSAFRYSKWPGRIAFGSSALLFLFAISMTISLGLKKPLDYSVFSASAGALLLALSPVPQTTSN
jgi:putative oxidoreductase